MAGKRLILVKLQFSGSILKSSLGGLANVKSEHFSMSTSG